MSLPESRTLESRKLAARIIEILNDRKGFGNWWHNIDEECQKEIVSEIDDEIYVVLDKF